MSKFIFSRIHFLPKQTFSRSPPSICVSNIIYTLARFPPFLRVSAESFVPGHPPPAMGSRNPFIRPSHNLLVLVFARPPVLTHSSTTTKPRFNVPIILSSVPFLPSLLFSFFLPSCSAPSPPSLPPWCFIYPPHVYLRSVFIHCFHHAMRSFRSPPLSV